MAVEITNLEAEIQSSNLLMALQSGNQAILNRFASIADFQQNKLGKLFDQGKIEEFYYAMIDHFSSESFNNLLNEEHNAARDFIQEVQELNNLKYRIKENAGLTKSIQSVIEESTIQLASLKKEEAQLTEQISSLEDSPEMQSETLEKLREERGIIARRYQHIEERNKRDSERQVTLQTEATYLQQEKTEIDNKFAGFTPTNRGRKFLDNLNNITAKKFLQSREIKAADLRDKIGEDMVYLDDELNSIDSTNKQLLKEKTHEQERNYEMRQKSSTLIDNLASLSTRSKGSQTLGQKIGNLFSSQNKVAPAPLEKHNQENEKPKSFLDWLKELITQIFSRKPKNNKVAPSLEHPKDDPYQQEVSVEVTDPEYSVDLSDQLTEVGSVLSAESTVSDTTQEIFTQKPSEHHFADEELARRAAHKTEQLNKKANEEKDGQHHFADEELARRTERKIVHQKS